MFLKKNVLAVLAAGFFVTVFAMSGFTEDAKPEPTQTDTGIVEESPDEKAKVIPASYQAVELVREFGMFGVPTQIVFSPDGKVVYVADQTRCTISAFELQGDLISSFGGKKPEYRARFDESGKEVEKVVGKAEYDEETPDKFNALTSVAVDPKGNIYVADYDYNVVKVFTPERKFILRIPLQGDLQKESSDMGAAGVAVNSRGDIYITNSANRRMQVNDLNGKYKYQITKFKDKAGKELALVCPTRVKINSLDEVYVIDALVCRVHRFNTKGGYMGSFGYMGDGAGGFNTPLDLAIDKLDRIYVADTGFSLIQVFSRQGKFLYALCDENGEKLKIPLITGVGVDSDNLIYVSIEDAKGAHVKVFKYMTKTTK